MSSTDSVRAVRGFMPRGPAVAAGVVCIVAGEAVAMMGRWMGDSLLVHWFAYEGGWAEKTPSQRMPRGLGAIKVKYYVHKLVWLEPSCDWLTVTCDKKNRRNQHRSR